MNKTRFQNRAGILQLSVLMSILLVITQPGCTTAAFDKPSLALEVQSAVSSGNVNVQLSDDGTAILTGYVKSSYDAQAAARAAARYEGVDQVINHIHVVRR